MERDEERRRAQKRQREEIDPFVIATSKQQILASSIVTIGNTIPDSMQSGAVLVYPNCHWQPVVMLTAWTNEGTNASITINQAQMFGSPLISDEFIFTPQGTASRNLMLAVSTQPDIQPSLDQFEALQFTDYRLTISSGTVFPQGAGQLNGSLVKCFFTEFPPSFNRDRAIQGCYPREDQAETVGYPLVTDLRHWNPETVATDRTRFGLYRPTFLAPLQPAVVWNLRPSNTIGSMMCFIVGVDSGGPLVTVDSVVTGSPPIVARTHLVAGQMPYHPFAAPRLSVRMAMPDAVTGVIPMAAILFRAALSTEATAPIITAEVINFLAFGGASAQQVDLDWSYLNVPGNTATSIMVAIMPTWPALVDENSYALLQSVVWSTNVPQEPVIGTVGFFKCGKRQMNTEFDTFAFGTPKPTLVPFLGGASGPKC